MHTKPGSSICGCVMASISSPVAPSSLRCLTTSLNFCVLLKASSCASVGCVSRKAWTEEMSSSVTSWLSEAYRTKTRGGKGRARGLRGIRRRLRICVCQLVLILKEYPNVLTEVLIDAMLETSLSYKDCLLGVVLAISMT